MPLTPSRCQRRRQHSSPHWDSFQATPTSQRLLSLQARQEGHAVVRVPPALREAFLEVAWVFVLYDRLFQTPKKALSPAQLAQFVAWSEATRTLVTMLREGDDDEPLPCL